MASEDLQTRIENARLEAGIDEEELGRILRWKFRVSSAQSLADSQAQALIAYLEVLCRYRKKYGSD